jgi:hypothetical protein
MVFGKGTANQNISLKVVSQHNLGVWGNNSPHEVLEHINLNGICANERCLCLFFFSPLLNIL